MTTKIARCNCVHKFQDEMYGIGNRMANETKSGQLRCTVCNTLIGSQHSVAQKMAPKEPVKEIIKEKVSKEKVVKEKGPKKAAVGKDKKEEKPATKRSMKGGKR